MLSLLIFLPIAGAIALLLIPKAQESYTKVVASAVALANLVVAVWMYVDFDQVDNALQFTERQTWTAISWNRSSRSAARAA